MCEYYPIRLKEEAAKRLEPWAEYDKVKGLVNYMMAEDWGDLHTEVSEYTTEIDKS